MSIRGIPLPAYPSPNLSATTLQRPIGEGLTGISIRYKNFRETLQKIVGSYIRSGVVDAWRMQDRKIAGKSVGKIIQFVAPDICLTHPQLLWPDPQRFQ